jgi:hypothetical protein
MLSGAKASLTPKAPPLISFNRVQVVEILFPNIADFTAISEAILAVLFIERLLSFSDETAWNNT